MREVGRRGWHLPNLANPYLHGLQELAIMPATSRAEFLDVIPVPAKVAWRWLLRLRFKFWQSRLTMWVHWVDSFQVTLIEIYILFFQYIDEPASQEIQDSPSMLWPRWLNDNSRWFFSFEYFKCIGPSSPTWSFWSPISSRQEGEEQGSCDFDSMDDGSKTELEEHPSWAVHCLTKSQVFSHENSRF